MKRILVALGVVALAVSLSGCDEQERMAALMANPQVDDIGDFDGCHVKYVDRGYNVNSFFIAKCGNTTTTSNNYMQQQGKTQVFQHGVTITQEIDQLQEQKDKTDARLAHLRAAMNKLTPEEQAALGITNQQPNGQ